MLMLVGEKNAVKLHSRPFDAHICEDKGLKHGERGRVD
jgi:hypothetical protein